MRILLPPFFILFTMVSCGVDDLDFDNFQLPLLTSRVAVPIGEASYTLRELIEEGDDGSLVLQEDSNSLLSLTYFDSVYFDTGENIIDIQDVSNSANVLVPVFNPSTSSRQETIDTVFVFEYQAEQNEEVDSVFYKEGQLQLDVTSNLSSDIRYNIAFGNTQRVSNNEPINFSGDVAGNGSTSESRNLNGYKTKLLHRNGLNSFEVTASIVIFLDPGESTNIGDDVIVTLTYRDQSFNLVYGKFGRDTINFEGRELNINFFEDMGESGIKFGNPELIFNFKNSFGIPMGILFSDIYGIDSTSTGLETTYLTGAATSTFQMVSGSEELGVAAESTILLNAQNSSLRDLLSKTPRTLSLGLTAITNPQDLNSPNFILDTSEISSSVEVSLPMEVSLTNLEERISFSLGSGLKFDETDSVSLRIISENELPLSAMMRIDIQDENDSVLYTVPQTLVMNIPRIGIDGIVTESKEFIADIPLPKSGILALSNGHEMVLTLTLNSPAGSSNDVYVKVLANYTLNVKLAAVGRLNWQL